MTPRPPWQIVAAVLALLSGPFLFNLAFLALFNPGPAALDVMITFDGLSPSGAERVRAAFLPLRGEVVPMGRLYGQSSWAMQKIAPAGRIFVLLPRAMQEGWKELRVTIGDKVFRYTPREMAAQWRQADSFQAPGGGEDLLWEAPSSLSLARSKIPLFKRALNWAGDWPFLAAALKAPLPYGGILWLIPLLAAAALLARRLPAGKAEPLLCPVEPYPPPLPGESRRQEWMPGLGGFLFVLLSLAWLEWMQPFYFVQDDNFVQFLPVILQGCRSLSDGVFPVWNPCQYMGAPTASLGVYALTYPLTYISFFIARALPWGENSTLEVFAFIHILLGYGAAYIAFRRAGMRPLLSALGGIAFVLSGFSLITGRSWYYFLPLLVFAPLLTLSVIHLQRGGPAGWRWMAGTGLAIGLFFHSGNAQMWAYGVMFFFLALLMLALSGALPIRRALGGIPSFLLGMAIAAPLFVPQAIRAARMDIPVPSCSGMGVVELLAMILPYPLVKASHPVGWGNLYHQYMGQFFYSGTLFTLAGLVAGFLMLGYLLAFRCQEWTRRMIRANVWILLALLSLVLCMGRDGILWELMSYLPVFNKFRLPFKFLAYANLFLCLGAGIILERLLRQSHWERKGQWAAAAIFLCLMAYHVSLAKPSFYSYQDRPYPPLPAGLQKIIAPAGGDAPGRILPLAPQRSHVQGYVMSLCHNFPSVYGVLSIDGYDPIVARSREFPNGTRVAGDGLAGALRTWGTRWIVVHDLLLNPVFSPSPGRWQTESVSEAELSYVDQVKKHAVHRVRIPPLELWELPGADPLCFYGEEKISIPVRFDGAGATAALPGDFPGGVVTVGVLCWPEIKAKIDGRPAFPTPDSAGRVALQAPPGPGVLRVEYCPPWGAGFGAGAVLATLSLIFNIGLMQKERGLPVRNS